MRYCISDLHGEYGLTCDLFDRIGFCATDELFVCGDVIDKGLESVKLMKMLFSMPNVKCVIGNHEYAFLKFYWSLMQSSPKDFDEVLDRLRAYFHGDGALLDWDVVDAMENLPYYIEEKDFLCVHAGIPLGVDGYLLPLEQVSREQFVHDRTFKEPSVRPKDSRCVFFGHTPTSYVTGTNEIICYPRVDKPQAISDFYKIHLDTNAWQSGVMGCVCIDTQETLYVKKKKYG